METMNKNEQVVMQQGMTDEQIEARIAEAIETARAEWQKQQAEQARVAAMTQEERAGYETSRREAELAEREKNVTRREVKAMALEELTRRGLPRELADAVSCESESECMKGIDRIERVFRQAVQSAVDERLRGEVPAAGQGRRADADSMTDAEYYRLNAGFARI